MLLGAFTLLGAILRFPFLSTQSFWVDEVFTRWVVDQHSLVAIWDQIRRTESTPPLYYLLTKLSTDLIGNAGPFALRLPSAVALTCAVPVSYMAVRRFIPTGPALATAGFVAVNPTLVNYGTDARSYGLLVLTGLLSIWALAEVLYDPAPRHYVWWGLACAAAVWTQYFAIFTLLGELVVLIVMLPEQRLRTMGAAVGLLLLVGGVAPLAIDQANSENSAFIAAIPVTHRIEDAVRQFGMGANVPRSWLEGLGLLLVYASLLHGLWLGHASRGTRVLALLLVATVGLPLLCAVLHLEDRFYMRNMMIGIPLLGALAAPALSRHRGTLMVAVGAVSCVVAVWVASDWRYGQADWRGAIAHASAAQRSGPVIVVDPGGFPRPASRHLPRPGPRPPGAGDDAPPAARRTGAARTLPGTDRSTPHQPPSAQH